MEFQRNDQIRYRENKESKWINGRVIIIDQQTITLRLETEDVVVLRKQSLSRETIRIRT